MSDSNVREALNEKHERNREQRIKAVKRWVAYIKSEPPEVWGPSKTRSSTTNLRRHSASGHRRSINSTSRTSLRTSRP